MLRSHGRGSHRLHTPGSSEADPVVEGYSRPSNQQSHPGRSERAQIGVGSRRAMEHGSSREDRYWRGRRKRKKNGLVRLKNLGTFQHNFDVLKSGHGELFVVRKTNGAVSYLPCHKCFGFYYKSALWRHVCSVRFEPERTGTPFRSFSV